MTTVSGYLLTGALHDLSVFVTAPEEQVEQFIVGWYEYLPFASALVIAVVLIVWLPRKRWIGVTVLAGMLLGGELGIMNYAVLLQPLYKGPRDAPGSLYIPHTASHLPKSRLTAEELNRLKAEDSDITYVPADVPSTGPFVVSVNSVDDDVWGAAALSRRNRCYLILTVKDPPGTPYGYALFGLLPEGEPCVGAAANPENVTSREKDVWIRQG